MNNPVLEMTARLDIVEKLVTVNSKLVALAYVKCFQEHTAKNAYSKPIEIWCCDLFKPVGPASFLPIVKIQEVCVTCNALINDEVVTAINPMTEEKNIL